VTRRGAAQERRRLAEIRKVVTETLDRTGSLLAASEAVVATAKRQHGLPGDADWHEYLTDKEIALARAAGQNAVAAWKRKESSR
jgi:hypothetical protein